MSSKKSDKRTKVLVFIKGLGIGGAEVLIAEGARHWNRDRFDYSVVYVLPWKDQLLPGLRDLGIHVTCVGGKRGTTPSAIARFHRLVKTSKPDLIHAHLPSSGVIARMVTTTPTIYTEHNIASSYREPTRTLNRLTYGQNKRVIAVSDAVAKSLIGYRGPTPKVVPNGVAKPLPSDSNVREELGIDSDTKLIVHVGNIRPHKGHTNLIAAAKTVELDDFVIVSIGAEKRPGDLARVRDQATAAGVGSKMKFLGRRPDARTFIDQADVFVNPSDVEGLPVSVLEALASSKPVVATAVGGVPAVIQNEVTGLLVPPGDPTALGNAIVRCLGDPSARSWGEKGALEIDKHHSIDQMIRSYESVYLEALND